MGAPRLTSSDVVDTALSLTLTKAADLLVEAAGALVGALQRRSAEFAATPMLGRTHGCTRADDLRAVLALYGLQVGRDRERLRRARAAVAVGKLSGAVGTYSNIDPRSRTASFRRSGSRGPRQPGARPRPSRRVPLRVRLRRRDDRVDRDRGPSPPAQ